MSSTAPFGLLTIYKQLLWHATATIRFVTDRAGNISILSNTSKPADSYRRIASTYRVIRHTKPSPSEHKYRPSQCPLQITNLSHNKTTRNKENLTPVPALPEPRM